MKLLVLQDFKGHMLLHLLPHAYLFFLLVGCSLFLFLHNGIIISPSSFIYPPGHEKRKSLFLWFLYDRTSFRSHTYTTDRPCVTLSAGKISAIYIKHWLRKRKINLTHSHAVAINTCNYAYVFDISYLILTW